MEKHEQMPLPMRCLYLVECHKKDTRNLKKSQGHPYQLRVTIDQGPKFVGKRVTVPLGTRDYHEAIRLRDMMLKALASGDFLTKDAKVRMKGLTGDHSTNSTKSPPPIVQCACERKKTKQLHRRAEAGKACQKKDGTQEGD